MLAARRVLCAIAVTALAVAGCSNTESPINRTAHTGSGVATVVNGVQQVTLEAGDDYRFHPSTITVHPGRVEIILKHTGTGAPHDWSLNGFPADFVPLTESGQTRMATFTAPSPGKYEFVCTIHLRQGQRGTLIVKAG